MVEVTVVPLEAMVRARRLRPGRPAADKSPYRLLLLPVQIQGAGRTVFSARFPAIDASTPSPRTDETVDVLWAATAVE
jgi:hypothetical protein